jgi:hypothetical protein
MVLATSADSTGISSTLHHQTALPDKTTTHYLENGPSYELDTNRNVKFDVDMPAILRDLTPEALTQMEKKLVRKVDVRLLPMLVLMYRTRSQVRKYTCESAVRTLLGLLLCHSMLEQTHTQNNHGVQFGLADV